MDTAGGVPRVGRHAARQRHHRHDERQSQRALHVEYVASNQITSSGNSIVTAWPEAKQKAALMRATIFINEFFFHAGYGNNPSDPVALVSNDNPSDEDPRIDPVQPVRDWSWPFQAS